MSTSTEAASKYRLMEKLYVGIIGTPAFCHLMTRELRKIPRAPEHFVSQLADGWAKTLEQHPNLLIVELGDEDDTYSQQLQRDFLEQTRERFGDTITIAGALTGVSHLLYAGELLFESPQDYKNSGLLNFFITFPSITSRLLSIDGLLSQIFELAGRDTERREKGGVALPTLNSESWIQSMGDIRSLELWIKWLPRYALYLEENPIIIGRTGTGKTNLSKALHLLSGRKGSFVGMTPRDFSSSELIQAEL
ncbi:MAG: hypothetical protein KDD60_02790, partial [Bdellovibrionales bacterium]|nr:hypothetical protein [Bdellovibrionales bacterium]